MRAPTVELYLGEWAAALRHVKQCDAVITDPPYSERVHRGQKHRRKVEGARTISQEGLGYQFWGEREVQAFVSFWHPRCAGWMCCFTDSELYPVWRDALRAAGRYVFAPLACVQRGQNVRLAGDGPSNWTTWLVVARTKAQSKWGTRRGAYHGAHRSPGDRPLTPGAKALWLMREIVLDYTLPGQLVVDPCAGSATTLLACALEGRRAIGAEVKPDTFTIGKARLSAHWRAVELANARQLQVEGV